MLFLRVLCRSSFNPNSRVLLIYDGLHPSILLVTDVEPPRRLGSNITRQLPQLLYF